MKWLDFIKQYQTSLIIIFIFTFVAIPRILATSEGLPYLHFWDEPLLGTGAINALKRGNIFPHEMEAIYGGFLRYTGIIIDAIYFQYLKFTDPTVFSISNIQTPMDGLEHAISHSGFYHLNRIYVSLLDTLGFVFLFLIGKQRFGALNGLMAAAIWASLYNYFYASFLIVPNHTLTMFIVACTYFAYQYHTSKNYKFLIYSLICSGLAVSTKMNGIVFLLVPFIAGLLNYENLKGTTLPKTILKGFKLLLIPFGVFSILNPHIYLDFNNFEYWMSVGSNEYATGKKHLYRDPGWSHFKYQAATFYETMGGLFSSLALLGIIVGLYKVSKKPRAYDFLIIGLPPIIYLLLITFKYGIAYHRNFIMLYPFLCLFAADAITQFSKMVSNVLNKKLNNWLQVSILITIIIIAFPAYSKIYRDAQRRNQLKDPRVMAMTYLEKQSSKDEIFLGIERGITISPEDTKNASVKYGFFSYSDLDIAMRGFTHLLVPEYEFSDNDSNKITEDKRRKLDSIKRARIISSYEGSTLKYARQDRLEPIVSPKVMLLKGSEYPPPDMILYIPPVFHKLIITLPSEKKMEIFYGHLDEGNYELKMQIMSTKAREEYPEFNLWVNGKHIKMIEANFDTFSLVQFDFKIIKSALNKVEIALTNDFWDPETGEDRNIFIRNLEVYKNEDSID